MPKPHWAEIDGEALYRTFRNAFPPGMYLNGEPSDEGFPSDGYHLEQEFLIKKEMEENMHSIEDVRMIIQGLYKLISLYFRHNEKDRTHRGKELLGCVNDALKAVVLEANRQVKDHARKIDWNKDIAGSGLSRI